MCRAHRHIQTNAIKVMDTVDTLRPIKMVCVHVQRRSVCVARKTHHHRWWSMVYVNADKRHRNKTVHRVCLCMRCMHIHDSHYYWKNMKNIMFACLDDGRTDLQMIVIFMFIFIRTSHFLYVHFSHSKRTKIKCAQSTKWKRIDGNLFMSYGTRGDCIVVSV